MVLNIKFIYDDVNCENKITKQIGISMLYNFRYAIYD